MKHRRGVDEQIQPTEALLHSSRSRSHVLLSVHIQPENGHPARVLLGHTPQLGRTIRAPARRNHRGWVLISQDVFAEFQPQSSAGSLDECDGGRHDCQLLRSAVTDCGDELDTLTYTRPVVKLTIDADVGSRCEHKLRYAAIQLCVSKLF